MWVVVAGTVSHMGGRVDFTLTFDSSPIKGEGDSVGVVLFTRAPAALWFPAYAERACATVVSSRYSAWRVTTPLDCGSSPR